MFTYSISSVPHHNVQYDVYKYSSKYCAVGGESGQRRDPAILSPTKLHSVGKWVQSSREHSAEENTFAPVRNPASPMPVVYTDRQFNNVTPQIRCVLSRTLVSHSNSQFQKFSYYGAGLLYHLYSNGRIKAPRPHKILCNGYNTFLSPEKHDATCSVAGDNTDCRGFPVYAHRASSLGPANQPQELVTKDLTLFITTNIYADNAHTPRG